mmetsp:Transcript_20090/g.62859  ORF Transcript_20090/g.62859 Transcript_20090/m.62859 type:complete len:407 (+) Transcript_20090:408-1628(+)
MQDALLPGSDPPACLRGVLPLLLSQDDRAVRREPCGQEEADPRPQGAAQGAVQRDRGRAGRHRRQVHGDRGHVRGAQLRREAPGLPEVHRAHRQGPPGRSGRRHPSRRVPPLRRSLARGVLRVLHRPDRPSPAARARWGAEQMQQHRRHRGARQRAPQGHPGQVHQLTAGQGQGGHLGLPEGVGHTDAKALGRHCQAQVFDRLRRHVGLEAGLGVRHDVFQGRHVRRQGPGGGPPVDAIRRDWRDVRRQEGPGRRDRLPAGAALLPPQVHPPLGGALPAHALAPRRAGDPLRRGLRGRVHQVGVAGERLRVSRVCLVCLVRVCRPRHRPAAGDAAPGHHAAEGGARGEAQGDAGLLRQGADAGGRVGAPDGPSPGDHEAVRGGARGLPRGRQRRALAVHECGHGCA